SSDLRGLGSRDELGYAQQIVGGADEVRGELRSRSSSVARAAEVGDGFDPAEDLLDPLADPLADGVAGVTSGAAVDRRSTARVLILGDVRRDVSGAALLDE